MGAQDNMRHVKKVRNLSPAFQAQLSSYALAAAAAGMNVLALPGQSNAEIIYKPSHHVISDGGSYRLDLTGNGTTTLTFQNKHHSVCTTDGCFSSSQLLSARMSGSNQVVHNVYGVVAMKPGMVIGPKDVFSGGRQEMAVMAGGFGTSGVGGSWVNVTNRYMGIKFKIDGKTHFGWARLSVQIGFPLSITATLTGYAYETVANKPIIAGKTKGTNDGIDSGDRSSSLSTLGRLALGRK